MDRHGKERLIGACILVALAVAVVPELLSGPKPPLPADAPADAVRLPEAAPDPVRNVTVDLATAKPAVADAASAAPAPRSAPSDGASVAISGPPSGAEAGAAQAGAAQAGAVHPGAVHGGAAPTDVSHLDAAPAHALETPAALPASGQAFAVQLGSFANRGNAEKLTLKLKAQGFAIYVNEEGSGPAARYRVRVGPLADRDAAERMIAKLKGLGQAATIVGPR